MIISLRTVSKDYPRDKVGLLSADNFVQLGEVCSGIGEISDMKMEFYMIIFNYWTYTQAHTDIGTDTETDTLLFECISISTI